jgi:hypothetical protein
VIDGDIETFAVSGEEPVYSWFGKHDDSKAGVATRGAARGLYTNRVWVASADAGR